LLLQYLFFNFQINVFLFFRNLTIGSSLPRQPSKGIGINYSSGSSLSHLTSTFLRVHKDLGCRSLIVIVSCRISTKQFLLSLYYYIYNIHNILQVFLIKNLHDFQVRVAAKS
jgi:hypothetical protein